MEDINQALVTILVVISVVAGMTTCPSDQEPQQQGKVKKKDRTVQKFAFFEDPTNNIGSEGDR